MNSSLPSELETCLQCPGAQDPCPAAVDNDFGGKKGWQLLIPKHVKSMEFLLDPLKRERERSTIKIDLPSRELTYPTLGKENHLQNAILGGYVSFLAGTTKIVLNSFKKQRLSSWISSGSDCPSESETMVRAERHLSSTTTRKRHPAMRHFKSVSNAKSPGRHRPS